MFNPSPSVTTIALGDGQLCHVFDDALRDPQHLIELAVARRGEFRSSGHNAFPGPELRMSDDFSAGLEAFFALHVRRALGGRRTLRAYSRLSLVTLLPQQLSPAQSICHRDRMQIEAGQNVAACVLYLFRDPALGGTAFYRPLRSEFDTARLLHDSGRLHAETMAAKYGLARGYQTTSSVWFEKIASVPARFNRLIFYNGMQFHSGDITAPERLTDDPRTGRLTLNGFFTCRQSAT
ncbi:MAG: DUF6445 family protein [Pseudomarimonas sp.]